MWLCSYEGPVVIQLRESIHRWLPGPGGKGNVELVSNLLLFSHSVMSGSLLHYGLQHARLPYPSPSPGACPASQWSHLTLYHPLLLSIFSSIRGFSNESTLHIRWLKYWSFSFSISPSHEYLGLISFRIDWFDCPAVQGTLKSLLQQHSSKASILWCSAFFMVQFSDPYMTTE